MIAIGNVLVSDQVIEEQFVCDLEKCKGGCCVDGDCGAPLTEDEARELTALFPLIEPFLDPIFLPEIERQGVFTHDSRHGLVTPAIDGGICAYGYTDELGVVKCGIEKAWLAGAIPFRKPVSCHLFPIRISGDEGYELVNYEPRKPMCRPACKQGKKLGVPVYAFLKEALTRRFGADFYEALDSVAKQYPEGIS